MLIKLLILSITYENHGHALKIGHRTKFVYIEAGYTGLSAYRKKVIDEHSRSFICNIKVIGEQTRSLMKTPIESGR